VLSAKAAHAQQSPGCLETGRGLLPEGIPGCPVGSPVSYLSRITGIPEALYNQGGITPGAAGVDPSAFYALVSFEFSSLLVVVSICIDNYSLRGKDNSREK